MGNPDSLTGAAETDAPMAFPAVGRQLVPEAVSLYAGKCSGIIAVAQRCVGSARAMERGTAG